MLTRILFLVFVLSNCSVYADMGYNLWLRYDKIENQEILKKYQKQLRIIISEKESETQKVAKAEIKRALKGLGNLEINESTKITSNALVIGTPESSAIVASLKVSSSDLQVIGNEGYIIRTVLADKNKLTAVIGNTDIGVLYGVFHLLRLLQTHSGIEELNIIEAPKIKYRILDHWDNLNGTVERGYAGSSIWDWQMLPGYIDPRYVDYARANASVGINGTVLNNVNASTESLTLPYIIKTAAIAKALRPYGMKVYLTAKFNAPQQIGGLATSDPLDPKVKNWWQKKVAEIYAHIPDFGGFLVKANSEGQPGPQDYKRSHADGANMMADVLAPYKGIVMWRTFVYENRLNEDRAKQAYEEFTPLDGKFNKNIFLQPKYGPIDFQPREAYNPLFGAMPNTPLMMEFQLTQEYLGFSTHLVYLAPLFKEYLNTDTYSKGRGSTIAKILTGDLEGHKISGVAGVANIGSDINWTGHPFAQSNWFAYGRMAWNPSESVAKVADDWLRMTFSNDTGFINPVKKIMLESRETAVSYMTPLGLNHIMNYASHYGPGPWYKDQFWDAWDYHQADSLGIGVNRSSSGTNAVEQYFRPLRDSLENIDTTPERLLLWFHHVPWDYKLKSGKTLWEEFIGKYYEGVEKVAEMENVWEKVGTKIDSYRYNQTKQLLAEQRREAEWWRDGSVLYWQSFSKLPLPNKFKKPEKDLKHYMHLPFPDRD